MLFQNCISVSINYTQKMIVPYMFHVESFPLAVVWLETNLSPLVVNNVLDIDTTFRMRTWFPRSKKRLDKKCALEK